MRYSVCCCRRSSPHWRWRCHRSAWSATRCGCGGSRSTRSQPSRFRSMNFGVAAPRRGGQTILGAGGGIDHRQLLEGLRIVRAVNDGADERTAGAALGLVDQPLQVVALGDHRFFRRGKLLAIMVLVLSGIDQRRDLADRRAGSRGHAQSGHAEKRHVPAQSSREAWRVPSVLSDTLSHYPPGTMQHFAEAAKYSVQARHVPSKCAVIVFAARRAKASAAPLTLLSYQSNDAPTKMIECRGDGRKFLTRQRYCHHCLRRNQERVAIR